MADWNVCFGHNAGGLIVISITSSNALHSCLANSVHQSRIGVMAKMEKKTLSDPEEKRSMRLATCNIMSPVVSGCAWTTGVRMSLVQAKCRYWLRGRGRRTGRGNRYFRDGGVRKARLKTNRFVRSQGIRTENVLPAEPNRLSCIPQTGKPSRGTR
jgi:hypothetical protein